MMLSSMHWFQGTNKKQQSFTMGVSIARVGYPQSSSSYFSIGILEDKPTIYMESPIAIRSHHIVSLDMDYNPNKTIDSLEMDDNPKKTIDS